MIVLFSGRFDPPHPGHIVTILRLARKYGTCKVVLLRTGERRFPPSYCLSIFEEVFAGNKKVVVLANDTHFAKITKQEIEDIGCDLYASNNIECLKHVEELGVKTLFTDRSFDYSSSKIGMPDS